MSRRFYLSNCYYGENSKLYNKQNITIKPGLTVLVGCNGIGKTTMLDQIENQLKKKNIPCVKYDNLTQGGSTSISEALFHGNLEFGATAWCSSEGENIVMNMGKLASKLGRFIEEGETEKQKRQREFRASMDEIFEREPGKNVEPPKERFILLDAVDSGLSVDNIVDLKQYLFGTIFEHGKNLGLDIYIIVSANEYEMAREEQCFDVCEGKYVDIDTYEEYRDIILRSRKYKEERDKSVD